MTMTLEQVRDILRTAIIRGHDAIAMADAIDAHLAQSGQSADVGNLSVASSPGESK